MDVITQSISLHCNALFLQGSMKTSQLLFSFFTLKKISQVHQVCRNDPSSITFSQLWWNSSQLACLFKVKVAMSPDQNTAHWFIKIDLLASVQKQQGHLSASAVNVNSRCLESGQYRLFWQNRFRLQLVVNVENIVYIYIYIYFFFIVFFVFAN